MNNYNGAAMAGIMGMIMTLWIVILIVGLIVVISNWVIYSKAGKPGWAAIIPIYRTIVELEIIGKPIWWILLLFIPLVNIIILIIMINELSKVFGKGAGFTLGLIFLPFIFYPILAFGDSRYTPPAGSANVAAV